MTGKIDEALGHDERAIKFGGANPEYKLAIERAHAKLGRSSRRRRSTKSLRTRNVQQSWRARRRSATPARARSQVVAEAHARSAARSIQAARESLGGRA